MRFKWLEKKADFRSSIDNTQNENESHKNRPEDRSSRHIPGKRKIIKRQTRSNGFPNKTSRKTKDGADGDSKRCREINLKKKKNFCTTHAVKKDAVYNPPPPFRLGKCALS